MTKISAMTALTGTGTDAAADYLPIIDASVADASKNKSIKVGELKVALLGLRAPTSSIFSYTANGTSSVQAATFSATRGLSLIKTDSGSAGERVSFLGKAVPASSPWTANAKTSFAPYVSSGSTIYGGGMALYNSSSGKFILYGMQNNSNSQRVVAVYYTGLNTFSADIGNTVWTPPFPVWFQIVESSTLYTLNYSYDNGQTWILYATALKATYFTADKVGFAVCSSTTLGTGVRPNLVVEHYDDPDIPL